MSRLIIILSIFIISGCCSQPEQNTQYPPQKVKPAIDIQAELAAIEEMRKGFEETIKTGRYEDIPRFVTSDVTTVGPGSSDWLEMYALSEERGRFPYDSIIMTPAETVIVSDSFAYDFGASRVFYTNKDGEAVELHDAFLVILKKESDGVWKIHREVASANVNESDS